MNWNQFVHMLDDLRHEGISTFAWDAVKTNVGALPYQGIVAMLGSYIAWPKIRDRINLWIANHISKQHESLKAELKEHITNEVAKLK